MLAEPYLRPCVPCDAVHSWEVPFRIGGAVRRTRAPARHVAAGAAADSGLVAAPLGTGAGPVVGPRALQPIRRYLEFQGPATPHDVAAFLDAPVTEVKKHWPEDAVSVRLDGEERWLIGEPQSAGSSGLVRLLGPYDLLLQGRDRDLIVPDGSRHKELWPVIGRPGAVLVGVDVVGTWRPARQREVAEAPDPAVDQDQPSGRAPDR